MYPTSRELIEKIILAIDETILPSVEEKQAASSLRSARTLLMHLARRVEDEPDILTADNQDAEATFGVLLANFEGHAACAPLASCLNNSVLAGGPLLKMLRERNEELQRAIDAALHAIPIVGAEGADEAAIRRALRLYLNRRVAREREMIMGAFLGSPF